MESKIRALEREAQSIEKQLAPWKGMTLAEARQKGFTDKEKKLQARLWSIGYKLISLKNH